MSLIKIKKLNKTFGEGRAAVQAIKDLSMEIQPGDIVLIMGPSGSGKTTLVSMIGTLMKPSSGEISINGKNLMRMTQSQLANLRLNKLGFVFQSFNLLAALDAEQNVMIPLVAAKLPKAEARIRAANSLAKLGMSNRLKHLPSMLSGGEKQRVAIARALVNNPQIILADEPTANLDSKSGREVVTLLCNIACAEYKAVIIVSHDPRLRDVAKRVVTIEDGLLTGEERGNHDKTCPHHSNHKKLRKA